MIPASYTDLSILNSLTTKKFQILYDKDSIFIMYVSWIPTYSKFFFVCFFGLVVDDSKYLPNPYMLGNLSFLHE